MSSILEENLVIRPKRSRIKKVVTVFLYCLFVLSAIVISLYVGYKYGDGETERREIILSVLQKDHIKLKEKYDSLLSKEAKLVQSQNVLKSAYTELEKSYELFDQRNEFLNRRVNFYRSILSPDDGISGVRIHDVSLREEENDLYFEIVLIQSINHEREATAKVYVELFETKQSRKPLASWKTSNNNFKFKLSEVVRGSLQAKQSLNGKILKIIVLPSGDSSKQLVEWHKV